jgi:hypothetical protein
MHLILLTFLSWLHCNNPTQSEHTTSLPDPELKSDQFSVDSLYARAIVSNDANSDWRIQKFLQKCRLQKEIKLGFIGGSITVGAGASTENKRYSTLFCNYINTCFPNLEKVTEINAGVSATGSRFGCSRISEDLLMYTPDLIVIEFAVNDWGVGDSTYIRSCMEGLIRQCFNYDKDIPVLLLYFPKGDGTNVQLLHSDVGKWYGLPMLSVRDAIWPIIQSNSTKYWNTFFYDDPHPNDNGHLIASFLLSTLIKKQSNLEPAIEGSIPEYRYSTIFEKGSIFHVNDSFIKIEYYGWNKILKEKDRCGFQTNSDTSHMSLIADCQEIAIGIRMQPLDSSNIHVSVDNQKIDTAISNYYPFEYTKFISLNLSDSTIKHTIQIKHNSSSKFTIEYILIPKMP